MALNEAGRIRMPVKPQQKPSNSRTNLRKLYTGIEKHDLKRQAWMKYRQTYLEAFNE